MIEGALLIANKITGSLFEVKNEDGFYKLFIDGEFIGDNSNENEIIDLIANCIEDSF